MRTWLLRGLVSGGEEIEAETAEEAREQFAEKYPSRTNGGNPRCTSQPIAIGKEANTEAEEMSKEHEELQEEREEVAK